VTLKELLIASAVAVAVSTDGEVLGVSVVADLAFILERSASDFAALWREETRSLTDWIAAILLVWAV
jgi:hypothetical protein